MVLNEVILGTFKPIEVIYLIIVTLVLGYIFTGMFNIKPRTVYDIMHPRRFNLDDFKFAVLITAPAVILHELAHKFVAIIFGFPAFFNIFPLGLGLALFLKLINSPLLIIAPGFVEIPRTLTDPIIYRLVAFSGPLINGILYIAATILLKNVSKLSRKQTAALALTKRINGILLIFNMIPLGPLDGAKVVFGP